MAIIRTVAKLVAILSVEPGIAGSNENSWGIDSEGDIISRAQNILNPMGVLS